MAAGIEIYNDYGVPQLLNDRGINLVYVTHGTMSVGSNTSASGVGGRVSLPTAPYPYIVFIRCNSGSAYAFGSTQSWFWHMSQGTTSFQYWVYGRPTASGNCGFQVWNADGTMQWDASQRPLNMYGLVNMDGAVPPQQNSETSTTNNLGTLTFNGWNNAAYCMSNMAPVLDIYTYTGGGNVIRANMRYAAHISTPNATQVQLVYTRVASNRSNSLGSNTSSSAFRSSLPSFLLASNTF